jgi:hypothetical protein
VQPINDSKLKQLIADFEAFLHTETKAFDNDNPVERSRRIKKALRDPVFFANTYMAHYTGLKPGPMHKEIDNALLSEEHKLFAIAGPREGGKTTRATILRPYQFLSGKRRFGIFASETTTLASARLSFFVAELKHNARIIADFDIKFIKETEEEIRVSVLAEGKRHTFRFIAISYKKSPRGETFMQYRPDYMEIDDFENRLTSRNPIMAREKVDMVKGEFYLAMSANSAIVWFGNNMRTTSALNLFKTECEEDPKPDMHFLHFRALIETKDGKKRSVWPAKWSVAELLRIRNNVGLILFNAEMQGEPMELSNYAKPEWLENYFSELPSEAITVAWCDPSLGSTGDFKVWAVVSYDGRYYYLNNIWAQQTTVNAMFLAAYSLYQKENILVMRMEDNFWQSVLFRDYDTIRKRKGFHLPLGGKPNTEKKDHRIESFIVELELGNFLVHEKLKKQADWKVVKAQTLGWPDKQLHDDGPDAIESAMRLAREEFVKRNYSPLDNAPAPNSRRRYTKTARH